MSQEIEILKDRLKFSDDALAAVEAKLVRAESKIRHLEQCRYPENAGDPTVDFNELAWRADRQDMLDEIAKLSNTVNEYAGTIKKLNENGRKLQESLDTAKQIQSLQEAELERTKTDVEFYKNKANQQLANTKESAEEKLKSLRDFFWTSDPGLPDEVRLRAGVLRQVNDWLKPFEKADQFWANDAESYYGQRLLDSIRDCQDMPCVDNKLGMLQAACYYVAGTLDADDMEQVEQGLLPF